MKLIMFLRNNRTNKQVSNAKSLVHNFCPGNETLPCKENFHIEDSFKIYWENYYDSGLDKEGLV